MNNYDAHKESIKGKTLNAYELADAMDTKGFRYREVKAAVKMLRQQQAEIEALKTVLEQEGIGVGRDLLNGGIALFRKAKNEQ